MTVRSTRPAPRGPAALALVAVCWLSPPRRLGPDAGLRLNDREYFETRGLNVLVFTNQYNGMFFDEKTAGIEIILHGVRLVDRRRGPPVAHAGAVGPDPEGRRPEGGQGHQHDHLHCCATKPSTSTRSWSSRPRARLPRRRHVDKPVPEKLEGRAGLNLEFLPSRLLRADVPRGRQARHLPAIPDRADGDQASRHEDPPVRGLLHVRRPRPERVRRSPSVRHGQDVRPRARGSRAPRHHPGRLRRPPTARRPQPLPERLVHRPVAAGDEDDGEGGRVGRASERHSELDAHPGDPVLAGRLPSGREEDGDRRTRRERHGAARRRRSSR